jgi:kynureninase
MTIANYENNLDFALKMDQEDPLASFRDRFHIPLQANGKPFHYFTGNSLGCMPKTAREHLEMELKDWEELAVEGHFRGKYPWVSYHESMAQPMAKIVGAKAEEVVMMNTLTVNLHLLMVSFYRPTKERFKIIIEADAFPSDIYAVESQIAFHGFDPKEGLIKLSPREGEYCICHEDIEQVIEEKGDEVALILLGGLNYYTGQVFDLEAITQLGHEKGCTVGFDLAHAAGNIPLKLHEWGVDFACWCTYKYINSGPGAVAGAFVHEKHYSKKNLPRFAGWWGHNKEERFKMEPDFQPIPTAEGWQLSNSPILAMAPIKASLEIFEEVGMDRLREKSVKLTTYLEYLLNDAKLPITIITPSEPGQRGCQLSLLTQRDGRKMFEALEANGVICDWREPDVIRCAPVPLYNSFEDVYRFVEILRNLDL